MKNQYSSYDVFVPGGLPKHTYVAREARGLEEKISNALRNIYKIVTVTGATKSGKTVLVRKSLESANPVWLDGGLVQSLDHFWAFLGDQLDVEYSDRTALTKEESYGVAGQAKGKVSVFLAQGELTVSPSAGLKHSSSQSMASISFMPARIRAALRGSGRPLVIDDFHYIPRDLQGSITRALKPLVFEGLPVVYLSIPHRRYDAIKVEKEMNGRIDQVQVPVWDELELRQIASLGFPLLGLDVHESAIDRFVDEAQGSPHLMQEFCRNLALRSGITTTVSPSINLRPTSELPPLFEEVAQNLGKNIFEKLAHGPSPRTNRKERKLRNGSTGDIYQIVLLGLASLTPGMTKIRYEDLRSHIRQILDGDPPPAADIYRVLEQMAHISSTDDSSSPVLDYDKSERLLHITDPFFAFFLRWSPDLADDAKRDTLPSLHAPPLTGRRFLGELDAALDQQLSDYFVLQGSLGDLFSDQSHIFYGVKGVGKTAICRAIAELNRQRFFTTGTIDLNFISFEQFHRMLSDLSASTGEEIFALARKVWRGFLVDYCLEFAKNRMARSTSMHLEINEFLRKSGFLDVSDTDRIFRRVADLFGNTADLPPTQTELLERCASIVGESGKVVAVCIDGFDSIVDHRTDSRKVVFAGLIDALFRLSRDRKFSEAFCFKAFLPRELTYEAQSIVWDSDKFLSMISVLQWDEESLKELLAKRLARYLPAKKREQGFESIWAEFMPLAVRNQIYGVEESSFSYILRHTQFRPRQLLAQVQSLLYRWDSQNSKSFRLDSSFISSNVSAVTFDIARSAVSQLELVRPGLDSFLRSWSGLSSTATFSECFAKMRRFFNVGSGIEAKRVFDELYEFGVFGVPLRLSERHRPKVLPTRFSYVGGRGGFVDWRISDEDIVAMCPMFAEYVGCKPSPHGLVQPVAG